MKVQARLLEIRKKLIRAVPPQFDLRKGEQLRCVRELADELIESGVMLEQLGELERGLLRAQEAIPIASHLVVKLARSKALLANVPDPCQVSVVFAVFKEHLRMLSPVEHELGEDFLRQKLEQLDWLFSESPWIDWSLSVVDDGCPYGSGALARQIIEMTHRTERSRVLYLAEGIEEGHPQVAFLQSTEDSQKGGAIQYGMARVLEEKASDHVVVYTDADLSTDLGQIGLLLDGIFRGGKDAAVGSRREPTSVVRKGGARNSRGKLFIYLWKRLLPQLDFITDTQCGFKAFRADLLEEILPDLIEKGFAFDIELLLKTALRREDSIARVPIAWIDSEAASTTTDLEPYLPMLKAVVAMYRHRVPASARADEFARFLIELDEDAWNRLAANVPPAIADGDPTTFTRFDGVSIESLKKCARA